MDFTITDGILAAAVTVIGTIAVTQSKRKDINVTEQRKDWRDYLRTQITELSKLEITSWNQDNLYSRVFEIRNNFVVRLNPYRDFPIIKKFDILLKNIMDEEDLTVKKGKFKESINEIAELVSILLKNDWERVKREQKIFGDRDWISIVLNLLLISSGLIYFYSVVIRFVPYDDESMFGIGFLRESRVDFSIFIGICLLRFVFNIFIKDTDRYKKYAKKNILLKKHRSKMDKIYINDHLEYEKEKEKE